MYKGIDLNDFDVILGSTTGSAQALNYIQSKGYSAVNFYDLRAVFSSPFLLSKLPGFILNLRSRGVQTIGAIRSSYSGFKQVIDWCLTQSNTLSWFNELNLEKEYWKGDGTFLQYIGDLDSTTTYLKTKNVRQRFLLTNYIGWMISYDSESLEMVKRLDRIQVHDYRTHPDESYTRKRMIALSKAAHQISKVQVLLPLFSAEPEFLGPYLTTHSTDSVYNSYSSAYNADTLIPYKSNLNLLGPHWFDFGYLKEVIP